MTCIGRCRHRRMSTGEASAVFECAAVETGAARGSVLSQEVLGSALIGAGLLPRDGGLREGVDGRQGYFFVRDPGRGVG